MRMLKTIGSNVSRVLLPCLAAAAVLMPQRGDAADFTRLSRDAALAQIERRIEALWPKAAKAFSRVDPSWRNRVPGQSWTDEDRKAVACIYDKAAEAGKLPNMEWQLDRAEQLLSAIARRPEVTLMTLVNGKHRGLLSRAKFDRDYGRYATQCGFVLLTLRRMHETGLMEEVLERMSKR